MKARSEANRDQRYVALLRGVNVGGNHIAPMAEVRALFDSLGFEDVRTYVQSGNVAFTIKASDGGVDESALAALIEDAFEAKFGFGSAVVLRTRDDLAGLAARNPYMAHVGEPTKVNVYFMAKEPAAEMVAALDPRHAAPDEFAVDGREAFVWFADGAGRSKLKLNLGIPATARNWNTVTKLLALLDAAD